MKARKMLLIATAMFQISGFALKAQEKWSIQPTQIKTRWAAKVDPMKPLSEYPRPQMERKNWQNLNGLWEYAVTTKDINRPSKYDGRILVPFPIESAISGVKKRLKPEQLLWYKTTISKPNSHSGDKILLHFGAVDFETHVFVNGKEIGGHLGGFTRFTFDVTNHLKVGKNELIIKVWDPSDTGIGPHGKQTLYPQGIMYTPSSGIWQTVWMETVPEQFISSLTITPDLDLSQVRVKVNSSSSSDVALKVAGKTVKGKSNTEIVVPISQVKAWSPDNPYLYDLSVRLGKDEVKSYFGMRKISLIKDDKGVERIALNNKPYYNLGVLDQGFWPDGLYTAPTDDALAFDIKASKAMGFNTIRKHIKVEPARWYYYADKLGMLVWQDMVNPNQSLAEGTKQEFEKESKEILIQLHNYPSITTWVLFNEKWGQYDQERLTKWIKETDPSRLVNGHSGEYLYVNNELRSPSPNAYINADMTDVHSYPYPRMSLKLPGKAQVLGEFGGIGVSIEAHLFDDTRTGWGYDGTVSPKLMQRQYSEMVDSLIMLKENGLSGSIYTQPFDVETEQNGLITYDREIAKISPETFRKINAKLWPTTENYVNTTKGFVVQIADSINVSFEERLAKFTGGNREMDLMRSLALMAQKSHPDIAKKVANEYIKSLSNPNTEANIKFISKFTDSPEDPGYNVIMNNLDKVKEFPDGEFAINKVSVIFFNQQIKSMLTDSPNWDKIDLAIKTIPGLNDELIWGSVSTNYLNATGSLGGDMGFLKAVANGSNVNAVSNLVKSATIYSSKYNTSSASYNQWAWVIFENSLDQSALKLALAWGKKAVELDPASPYQIDTYANLLYKLGQKSEAIEWEKKAVKIAPTDQAIADNLEKMKNGVKTWKE